MTAPNSILVVTADPARRSRAESALADLGRLVFADRLGAALQEVGLDQAQIAVLDSELPGEQSVIDILSALGEPGRAIVWVATPRSDLLDYGGYIQIPHSGADRILADACRWLLKTRTSRDPSAGSSGSGELDRVLDVVARVRHDLNNPLTAILAETQLLLMDDHELTEEQARSLRSVEEMAQRMREMVKDLRQLKRD